MSYVGSAVTLVHTGAYRVPISGWAVADTTEPLAHFPPGFSTAIAVPVALGIIPLQAGRLVVVLAAFVTASMLYLLVSGVAGAWPATITVVCAIVTPALVDVHLSILSEPLFLAAVVCTVAAMRVVAERPEWRWRLALGAAAAAAVMVRYVGVAVVGAAALWVLTLPGPWPRRVRDAVTVVVPGGALTLAWVLRATHEAGKASVRKFAMYGGLGASLHEGASTVADWLAPGLAESRLRWVVALIACILALAAILRLRNTRPRERRLVAAALLVLGACAAMLMISRLIADPNIPFDERILSPLILLAELAIVVAGARWGWRGAIVVGVWVIASLAVSVQQVRFALQDGDDFAGTDWRFSPTVDWVRQSGAGHVLYSNWPAALYFHAGRGSHFLPEFLDPATLRRFGDRLARNDGLVVAFDVPSPDVAPPDSIAGRLRLRLVARLDDGTIWASSSRLVNVDTAVHGRAP